MAEAMYDSSIMQNALRQYLNDYEPDANYGYSPFFCGLGPCFELTGISFLQWAGQKAVSVLRIPSINLWKRRT